MVVAPPIWFTPDTELSLKVMLSESKHNELEVAYVLAKTTWLSADIEESK